MLERILPVDVARGLADHHAELDLPVGVRRVRRQHDVVVGTDDARLRLVEHDRMLGDRVAGFLGMVDVVQADRDELRRHGDAGTEPRAALDQRQFLRVELAQLGELARREGRRIDVLYLARQIAQLGLSIDQSGLFLAGRAVTYEFHAGLLDCSR